jgi:hypothetical protein
MIPSDRRALRMSLALGGIYDLLLALVILTAGERMMAGMGHPVRDSFYFALAVLPLLLLPVLYVTASRAETIDEFRPPVLWARVGGGFIVILFALIFSPRAAWLFFLIGGLDLVWAGVHLALWRPPRNG